VKKKILFFENTGYGTGSSHSLKAILGLLDRNSYEVVLWFGDRGNSGRWPEETLFESRTGWLGNVDFFPAGWRFVWIKHFIGFLLKSLRDLFSVPAMLKKLNPDIIHINSGQGLVVGLFAKRMGIPLVWHIRELVCLNWLGRIQDRIYAYAADQIIAISDAVALRLPRSVQRGKVVRMYNAVGAMRNPALDEVQHFRKQWGLTEDSLTVLLLANVSEAKGYGFLADVADKMEGESIQFILAGRGSGQKSKEVRRIYKKWEAHLQAGRAVFPGLVDAATAIASADVIVCPNVVAEPLGRTVLESYIFGRPVIAMNLPAFNETIINGKTGWLLPKEPHIWADKLEQLADNRSLLSSCSSAIKSLSEKFSDEKYMTHLQSIYARLMADN
jgi:glycosyltransferase involved in cell wall biosynthesis